MTAPHDPLNAGIWRHFLDGDQIAAGQWMRAKAAHEFVGECRVCGGYLTPGTTYQSGRVEWYEAKCVQCGREIAAPGGRVLRRSGRHSEQPADWWDKRIEAMNR